MDHDKFSHELDELRAFIDFLNKQVGVYMDCLAGFQGNVVRVERQVARISRPVSKHEKDGQPVVVWSSLEDPSSPDVIHNRIMRSSDYVADNMQCGFNERQVCWSIIVFIFARWDEEVRPKIAAIRGLSVNEVSLDAFGDLRLVRIAIIHNGGLLSAKDHNKLRLMGSLFQPDQLVSPDHDEMHQLFVLLKQGIGTMILNYVGHLPGAPKADELKDIAISSANKQE